MRLLPLLATALALSGCTDDRTILARPTGDGVEFVPADTGPDAGCVSFLRVTDAKRDTLWEIEALNPDKTGIPCATRMPLRFGVVPPKFTVVTPARPLQPGTDYGLIGNGDGFLRASFRTAAPGRPLVNYPPGSAAACAIQFPGTTPNWMGICVSR